MLTDPGFYFVWLVLTILPLMIAIGFGVATLLYKEQESNHDRWNNGYCECGGQYQFSSATNYRGSKDYYYTCDECGHTERFSSIMR